MDSNSVVIVTKDGPTVIPETKFELGTHKLARGSRIPGAVAVELGTTADHVLNSIAGNPDDAPDVAVGLIPVAYNPPYPNLPQNFGGAPGSTNALDIAKGMGAPAPLLWDAAVANPDSPIADDTNYETVDTGQIFVAKVGPVRMGYRDQDRRNPFRRTVRLDTRSGRRSGSRRGAENRVIPCQLQKTQTPGFAGRFFMLRRNPKTSRQVDFLGRTAQSSNSVEAIKCREPLPCRIEQIKRQRMEFSSYCRVS